MSISCLAAGITKSGNENKIAVFPNPASKELTVKMNGEKFSRSKISVLNLLGETIYSAIEISTGNSTVKRIDVSTLAKGIYFLKVETGTYTNVSRFLKN